jgi:hypothetical protein
MARTTRLLTVLVSCIATLTLLGGSAHAAGRPASTIEVHPGNDNQFDLANLGQNNCFKHNQYETSEGQIGC